MDEENEITYWNKQYYIDIETDPFMKPYKDIWGKDGYKEIMNNLYGVIDPERTYPHWVQIGGEWFAYDRKPPHSICFKANCIVVKIDGKLYWAKHRHKSLGKTINNELSDDDMREMTFVILRAERGKV